MIEHKFKKKFGQNFLTDKNLLNAIAQDAGLTKDDDVLEIGAGAGALTQILSQNAKSVVSYEIDTDLKETLLSLNLSNVKFYFQDIMKVDIETIEKDFKGEYKVVANLPYYITSPIIFKFLSFSKKLSSLTIMVQKEVAQRIIAGSGGDYGVLSIMVQFFGEAKITRIVSRKLFYPEPNVDSAVVRIDVRRRDDSIDSQNFLKFVQTCFSMRRKTLKNNLSKNPKYKIDKIEGEYLSKRAESFTLDQLIMIYKNLVEEQG